MVSLTARFAAYGRMPFSLSSHFIIFEASGKSRVRWIASNSHFVVHRPQPMHLF